MEKFIPVVVIKELSETDKILTALKNYGIECAEITFRTACAKEAIEYAVKKYPEMNIGAGTVINAEQCEQAIIKKRELAKLALDLYYNTPKGVEEYIAQILANSFYFFY